MFRVPFSSIVCSFLKSNLNKRLFPPIFTYEVAFGKVLNVLDESFLLEANLCMMKKRIFCMIYYDLGSKIMPRLHSFAVAIGFGLEHGGELRIPVVGRQMYVPWL